MLAGGVASIFEESLKREVTLAFFLPLVVYMADAIGTQTETILVRRMVYGRVSLFTQLWREASLGLLIGLTIGGAAWMGLWLLDGRGHVAAVVALTILCSSIVATLIASLLALDAGSSGALIRRWPAVQWRRFCKTCSVWQSIWESLRRSSDENVGQQKFAPHSRREEL